MESLDKFSIPENRHLYVATELAKLADEMGFFNLRYDSKKVADRTSPYPVDLQSHII
jgi:hypothetical protein